MLTASSLTAYRFIIGGEAGINAVTQTLCIRSHKKKITPQYILRSTTSTTSTATYYMVVSVMVADSARKQADRSLFYRLALRPSYNSLRTVDCLRLIFNLSA